MTNIGTHGLSCLEDTDYGAVALSMQANGQAIDSSLGAISDDLNAYRNRRWLWCTNPSAINVDSASGSLVPPIPSVGQEATASSFTVTNNGMPTAAGSFFPAGMYLVGSSINYTVATPNNGTLRTLEVYGVRTIDGVTNSATTYTSVAQMTLREASTGGTASMNVSGVVYTPGGNDLRFLNAAFFHSNTSSVLVVPAGGWILWYTYLGSGVVV